MAAAEEEGEPTEEAAVGGDDAPMDAGEEAAPGDSPAAEDAEDDFEDEAVVLADAPVEEAVAGEDGGEVGVGEGTARAGEAGEGETAAA